MISPLSIPSHTSGIVMRKINNECLLIPLTSDIADMDSLYRLNETGAFIWEAIDGKRSVRDITLMMTEEFSVEAGEAERDILIFLTAVQDFIEFGQGGH